MYKVIDAIYKIYLNIVVFFNTVALGMTTSCVLFSTLYSYFFTEFLILFIKLF